MKRVIVITGKDHFDGVTRVSREPDDELLRQALLAQGIDVQVAVWNDPLYKWEHTARKALVVIRSCWVYHSDQEGSSAGCSA